MSRRTLSLLSLAALATIAAFASAAARGTAAISAASASCPTVSSGELTIGTDNPAYPPWYAGGTKIVEVEDQRPVDRQGLRVGRRVRDRQEARLLEEPGEVDLRPVQQGVRSGQEVVRLRHQPDLVHARTGQGRRLQRLLLRREPGDRRQQGHEDRVGRSRSRASRSFKLGAQLGTTSYQFITSRIKPSQKPAVFPSNAGAVLALKNKQIDGLVVDLPDGLLRDRGAGAEQQDPRPVRECGGHVDRSLRRRPREAQPAHVVRQHGDHDVARERHAQEAAAAVAGEGDRRADLEVGRRSRVLDSLRSGGDGRRSVAIALAQHRRLLHRPRLRDHARAGLAGGPQAVPQLVAVQATFPEIARAFLLNVKIFCIAEVFILDLRALARGVAEPARGRSSSRFARS